MSKAETAEKAVENINVVAETGKIIDNVSKMSWEGVLHEWVIPYGTKFLLAIAIFIIGKFLARAISKLLGKAALASTKDEMIRIIDQLLFTVIDGCDCQPFTIRD